MIAATIARLEATKSDTGLKLVGGAAEFQAAAEANPKATPAAFVIPLRESGGDSPTYGRTRQKVSAGVGVVLVVKNLADARGESSRVDLESLRAKVDAMLLGWPPTAEHDPLEFDSGALLAFKDGHQWWQDAYRTQFTKSSA